MKKLLIVLCLSLGIVGCGGDKHSDIKNSTTDSGISEITPNTIILEAPGTDINMDSVAESEPSSEPESSDESDVIYDGSGLNRVLSLLGKQFKDSIQINELSDYSVEGMKGADIDSEPYVPPYSEYEFSFDGDGVDFKCLNLTSNYERIDNLNIVYATLSMQYVDKYLNLDIDVEDRENLQNSVKELFGSPIGSCTIVQDDLVGGFDFSANFKDLLGYSYAESADVDVYSKDDIIIFHTYSVTSYPENYGSLTFIYKPYLKQVFSNDNILNTLGFSNDTSIMDRVKTIEKVSPEDSVTQYNIRYYDRTINVNTDKVETDVVAYPLSDGTYSAPNIFMFKFRYTSDFYTEDSMVLEGMHKYDLEDYKEVVTIDGATLYCETDDYYDSEDDEYKVYIANIDGVWVHFDESENDEYIESNFSSFVKGFRESMIVE